jgi:predicted dehydrogenase
MENIKFLIIGLGSMGKRRIRNLKYLKETNIVGFDITEERREETKEKYGIKTVNTIEKAFNENPNAIIISTPPHLHEDYMKLAIEKNIPFFTELNLISKGLNKIVKNGNEKNILMASSCDMRYIESIKKIKELIKNQKIGKVTSFAYHVGQYLPDWHPWEDYRKFFASRKDTNGCVEVIPGELNWMEDIFGKITSVMSLNGKYSDLEIDSPDTYQIILKFKNNLLGNYMVDVVSRVPCRNIRIIGTEGIIEWDHGKKLIKMYTAKNKKWEEFPENEGTIERGYIHKEEPYIEEMSNFIKALKKGEKYPFLLNEELEILKILNSIEKSTKKRKEIKVGE